MRTAKKVKAKLLGTRTRAKRGSVSQGVVNSVIPTIQLNHSKNEISVVFNFPKGIPSAIDFAVWVDAFCASYTALVADTAWLSAKGTNYSGTVNKGNMISRVLTAGTKKTRASLHA